MADVKQEVKEDLAKAEGQWAFVRQNWTQVSIIIIATFVLGAVVGHLV